MAACFVSARLQPISTPKTIQFDFVLKGIFCFGVLLRVQLTSFCRSGWFLVYTSSASLAYDREIERERKRERESERAKKAHIKTHTHSEGTRIQTTVFHYPASRTYYAR